MRHALARRPARTDDAQTVLESLDRRQARRHDDRRRHLHGAGRHHRAADRPQPARHRAHREGACDRRRRLAAGRRLSTRRPRPERSRRRKPRRSSSRPPTTSGTRTTPTTSYIYDYETGICVSNPGVATLLGKDMRGVKDANGLPFAQMLMDLARQGQGSLRYTFLRSATDPTPLDKVAFTRGFAPWHLMIGTATYHLGGRCVVLVDGQDRFRRHRRADAALDRDRLADHPQRGQAAVGPEAAHGLAQRRPARRARRQCRPHRRNRRDGAHRAGVPRRHDRDQPPARAAGRGRAAAGASSARPT